MRFGLKVVSSVPFVSSRASRFLVAPEKLVKSPPCQQLAVRLQDEAAHAISCARVEARIQCAIGIQPCDPVAGHASHRSEKSAYDDLPVRLQQDAKDRVVHVGIETGIQRPFGIQSRDPVGLAQLPGTQQPDRAGSRTGSLAAAFEAAVQTAFVEEKPGPLNDDFLASGSVRLEEGREPPRKGQGGIRHGGIGVIQNRSGPGGRGDRELPHQGKRREPDDRTLADEQRGTFLKKRRQVIPRSFVQRQAGLGVQAAGQPAGQCRGLWIPIMRGPADGGGAVDFPPRFRQPGRAGGDRVGREIGGGQRQPRRGFVFRPESKPDGRDPAAAIISRASPQARTGSPAWRASLARSRRTSQRKGGSGAGSKPGQFAKRSNCRRAFRA